MLDAGLEPGFRKIATGLTLDEAHALERETIVKLGRVILGTGPLTNTHEGGWRPGRDGLSGPSAGMDRRRQLRHEREAPLKEAALAAAMIARAERAAAARVQRAEATVDAMLRRRQTKRLTPSRVASISKPGRHADGENLYLAVRKTPGGFSKSWVFFYSLKGRQREAGLGSADRVSLAQARRKAQEWRAAVALGLDPLDQRKAATAATAARKTFGQCATELVASKRAEWRSAVHQRQWETTLTQYCTAIRDRPVDEIDVQDVLSALTPIWRKVPTTAQRLRGRIEFDD